MLARLEEPNLLICETCLDTGTRISEVTGLMIKHVDLEKGPIRIEQRNWRGDIDDPKTAKSKRTLALGGLAARYETGSPSLKHKGPNAWVFPQEDDLRQPRWDSGVRKALKTAAEQRESLRLPRLWAALPAPRQHHVAAGGRRQQHRDQQDRRPRQHGYHRGVHASCS